MVDVWCLMFTNQCSWCLIWFICVCSMLETDDAWQALLPSELLGVKQIVARLNFSLNTADTWQNVNIINVYWYFFFQFSPLAYQCLLFSNGEMKGAPNMFREDSSQHLLLLSSLYFSFPHTSFYDTQWDKKEEATSNAKLRCNVILFLHQK